MKNQNLKNSLKKVTVLILAALMLFSFAACSEEGSSKKNKKKELEEFAESIKDSLSDIDLSSIDIDIDLGGGSTEIDDSDPLEESEPEEYSEPEMQQSTVSDIAKLDAGDKFAYGEWEDEPLVWVVLNNDGARVFAMASTSVLAMLTRTERVPWRLRYAWRSCSIGLAS